MRGSSIWHVILLLILASVIMGVIQLAIVFLIVWGLLFRTRETVGMLTFFFLLGLIDRYPWAGVSLLALIAMLSLFPRRSARAGSEDYRPLPPPR